MSCSHIVWPERDQTLHVGFGPGDFMRRNAIRAATPKVVGGFTPTGSHHHHRRHGATAGASGSLSLLRAAAGWGSCENSGPCYHCFSGLMIFGLMFLRNINTSFDLDVLFQVSTVVASVKEKFSRLHKPLIGVVVSFWFSANEGRAGGVPTRSHWKTLPCGTICEHMATLGSAEGVNFKRTPLLRAPHFGHLS